MLRLRGPALARRLLGGFIPLRMLGSSEAARANRAEVERLQWNPRLENILSTQACYAAPVYSATCGSHFVWDQVISSPVVAKRGVTRDGVTYVTEYSDFDEYGRARATAEYALGQKGFSGTQPVPASTRSTAWTYYAAPSLNIVSGHPLTKAVCLGIDCIETSWTYSERGARTSETISGVTTTFGYFVDGNLFSVTNALGQVLKIKSYEYGTATDFDFNGAFGVTRTVSWEGRTLTETDGRGYTATHTYDDIGRPLTLVPPGPNNSTSYSYAPDNSWAREARGTYFRNTYLDALGRVISTADSEGVLTTSRYDAMGWSWFTSYAHDTTIGEVGDKTERDGLGRPTIVTNAYRPVTASCDVPGACTVTFLRDAGCTATQVARAPGESPVTTWRCNWYYGDPEDGRLIQVFDAGSSLWEYRYTVAGNIATVTGPTAQGNRSFAYDVRQFLVAETTGESGTIVYERNALGQMTRRTDARQAVASYLHADPLGRLTGIEYLGGAADDVTQHHDNANNVTHVSSASGGTFDYDHDELNRQTRQTWSWSQTGQSFTAQTVSHYDSAGCLDSLTYPSGLTLTMTCDTANRVKSISAGGSTIVSDVIYHPSGQPAVVTHGNGTIATSDYDDRGRTRSVTVPGVMALLYGQDGADNVVSFEDAVVPGSRRTMGYDRLDRLISAIEPAGWGTIAYDYDKLGNRTLKSGSVTTTYEYDSRNLLATASGPETYRSMTFTWDVPGRLASSSDGATYGYDARGRRVRKTEAGQTTLYHYDAAGRVIAESAAEGGKLRDYLYLGNKLVAVDGCIESAPPSCSDRQWYHTDTLGSVVARTSAVGTATARFDYQPWGEQWVMSGTSGDRQYNGRVYDAGTGFHDYGARMYWPQIGRFISADMYQGGIGNPASLNRYSYVLNNPTNTSIPLGSGAWGFIAMTHVPGLFNPDSLILRRDGSELQMPKWTTSPVGPATCQALEDKIGTST